MYFPQSMTINEHKWKLNENHAQIEEKHRTIKENHWKMEENHGTIEDESIGINCTLAHMQSFQNPMQWS